TRKPAAAGWRSTSSSVEAPGPGRGCTRGGRGRRPSARVPDLLADDLGQAQHARTGRIAVREQQVDLHRALGATAQGQRLEYPLGEFGADLVLGEPGEAVAAADRADRRGHVRHRPADL